MRAMGIGVRTFLRPSIYTSKTPKRRYKKLPGRPVGFIEVKPINYKENDYNPLTMIFTVSPYRKDFYAAINQSKQKGKLSDYQQLLFDSCFKNW